jgi:hypothetical protein
MAEDNGQKNVKRRGSQGKWFLTLHKLHQLVQQQ